MCVLVVTHDELRWEETGKERWEFDCREFRDFVRKVILSESRINLRRATHVFFYLSSLYSDQGDRRDASI